MVPYENTYVYKVVPYENTLRHMLKESATIMVQEAIKLLYVFQGSEQKQQKSPSGSKAHLVTTSCLLNSKLGILCCFQASTKRTSATFVVILFLNNKY